ncbi:ligase-associated DNA damage response exonuclease [Gemmata sp. JC673]|uniref:Ligase-associated DNA damage response exonuclease n=1 Tax=Gemmata algarum TaxID=2975278 RepID=A0ABU5EXG6_9BACT|nr:ligase-associated DNA damage response exonuclease [Gemmata algarum]MDY3559157.1 ligase-associated DNA damage response exonuclease [Gemmata algarum]
MSEALISLTDDGLYCPAGDFHIDPWNPVPRAVVTHAHADHARWGCGRYLAAESGAHLLHTRLGAAADIATVPYGQPTEHNGVQVSFHPAGHVLGSAQVRVEYRGEVWVVTGDYKLDLDPTCQPFEPVRCHTFITESTFGLPIYRWETPDVLFGGVNAWWAANKAAGKCSIVYAYALGKSQRVMAGVDPSIGPIYTHGAVEKVTRAYRESGVLLPPTTPVSEVPAGRGKAKPWAGALVLAPPSAAGSPWARKFEPASEAVASGWARVRGARRRKAVDRGFVLSDHADWPGLLTAVRESGASRVLATHGFAAELARYLREGGLDAGVIATRYGDEEEGSDSGKQEVEG